MENQDKIYKQFQDAAAKVESKDFHAMDKVWGNLENKLDKTALKKENKTWKKLAVAASVLLVATCGYQFFKFSDKEEIVPKNEIVTTEKQAVAKDSILKNEAIVDVQPMNPLIKENAPKIIQNAIKTKENVAINDPIYESSGDEMASPMMEKTAEKSVANSKNNGYFSNRKFNAVGVTHYDKKIIIEEQDGKMTQEKPAPLVILDGKATKSENVLSRDDIEVVTYLNDPLYIINGVEYTENELFGANPTSPYFPLNKQNIISTTVLQGESATNLYGEKGKKGVVIIATKNKIPAEKKN